VHHIVEKGVEDDVHNAGFDDARTIVSRAAGVAFRILVLAWITAAATALDVLRDRVETLRLVDFKLSFFSSRDFAHKVKHGASVLVNSANERELMPW
jgi:hypothetical protein